MPRVGVIRMFAIVGTLVAGTLAGCVAPVVTESETPASEPPTDWTTELSQPIYDGIISAIARTTSADGTSLSLAFHLPQGLPEGERVPTLLRLTPYQGGTAGPFGYGRTSTPMGTAPPPGGGPVEATVLRGAAFVEGALRGTAGSGGCIDFGGDADRGDAQAFVAWIRAQPWSNGVVVTAGISHDGMASVAAHVAVQDLGASIAYAASLSYYLDEWYQGARFDRPWNGPVYTVTSTQPVLYVEPESQLAKVEPCTTTVPFAQLDGRHGPYWDERDNARFAHAARAPLLLTHGFLDTNVLPNAAQSYWDALPEAYPKWSVWGWFAHTDPDFATHPLGDFALLRQQWIDATLFGHENGLWETPRVLAEDNLGVWHESATWPLDHSERVRFHARDDGALVLDAPNPGSLSYTDREGANRPDWRDAHVAFRSEPLAEARLVSGAPKLHLVASSDQIETKWVVYLLDEAPDGTRQRVTQGYADSHTYAGEDEWREMTPGSSYAWDIQLLPTAWVVEPGHRLVLLVASQDSGWNPREGEPEVSMTSTYPMACWPAPKGECYWPMGILPSATAGRAVNTVHTGEDATLLELHWADPMATTKATHPGIVPT